MDFKENWGGAEPKQCCNVVVEATNLHRLHPTSMSYVYTVFQHLDDNGNGTMGYDNDDEGNGRQQQRRHGRQTSDRSRQLLSRVLIALGGVCFRVTSSTQYPQNGTIMGDSGTKSVCVQNLQGDSNPARFA